MRGPPLNAFKLVNAILNDLILLLVYNVAIRGLKLDFF